METSPELLLVREDDLLILGVRWSGFNLVPGTSTSAPKLVALPTVVRRITLLFPPQSIAETKYIQDDDTAFRSAVLSNSSRVAFTVEPGTEIPLNVAGFLTVLLQHGRLVGEGEDLPTLIEMPWHLSVTVKNDAGEDIIPVHSPTALKHDETGITGLWDLYPQARVGTRADPSILVLPLANNPDDGGFDLRPLSGDQRQMIFQAADGSRPETLARARLIALSSLGGSFSVSLRTTSLEWDHETTFGRDLFVRISTKGVLYPCGHRAVYEEIAERVLLPDGSRSVAGLHRKQVLTILEQVRPTDDDALNLQRSFPFHEVEILQRTYSEIAPASFESVPRPQLPIDDLVGEIANCQQQIEALHTAFQQAFDDAPHSLAAYRAFVLAPETQTASGVALLEAIINAALDPNELERQRQAAVTNKANAQRQQTILLDQLGQEGADVDAINQQINDLQIQIDEINADLAERLSQANIDRVRAEEGFWDEQLAIREANVANEFFAQDTLDEFIAVTSPSDGETLQGLTNEIVGLQARIQQITEAARQEVPAYWLPLMPIDTPGADTPSPIQFAVRCAGSLGDVFFSIPMIFVRDDVIPAADHFETLALLTDQGVRDRVSAKWDSVTAGGKIPLHGARVDLIRQRSGPIPPSDVHEVQTITLFGLAQTQGFRPQLSEFEVELPALRTLLPTFDSRQVLTFSPAFVADIAIPELPLLFKNRPDVDFTRFADRSGGLISPKFSADGISRTFGPVAASALPANLGSATFDLEEAFKGTTLLGFPLTSLIRLPETPASNPPVPPAIEQIFDGVALQGTRMRWQLALKANGVFLPNINTVLNLIVERFREKQSISCSVNDFSLTLPPNAEEPLIKLSFQSLEFTQQGTQAPRLDLKGFDITFGGALRLLQELTEKLQELIRLPNSLPKVDVDQHGLNAAYVFSVPEIPAGTFMLRNIAIYVGVYVPFDGRPLTASLSFARRSNPFTVTVLSFGGGGYIEVEIGAKGLLRLEASIDFGAFLAVDFVVVKGEVHAFGGICFTKRGDSIEIAGFINIGGSVEVLGLVSVSIALTVSLTYESEENRLIGRAKIVIEIDLTLFSESVVIDSGDWVLAGSDHRRLARPLSSPILRSIEDSWKIYSEAFSTL